MIAGAAIRLTLAFGLVTALANPIAAETRASTDEQWRPTDRSMAELVAEGYELVSVIAPSNQARTYFLRKTGKVAKCREEASLDGPLPAVPPLPPKGQSFAMLESSDVPKMRTDIECAVLVPPEHS
jgi:hypothetical protein